MNFLSLEMLNLCIASLGVYYGCNQLFISWNVLVRICLHQLSNSVVISSVGSVTLIDSAIGLYLEIVVGSFTLQKM